MSLNKETKKRIRILLKVNKRYLSNFEKKVQLIIQEKRNAEQDHFQKYLKTIPADKSLKNYSNGARIGSLMYSGINTLKDLQSLTYARLIKMQGIGPSSANKIMAAIPYATQEAKKKYRFKIDGENPSKADIKLLKLIHSLIEKKNLTKIHTEFANQHRRIFKKALHYSHPIFMRVFKRKSKRFFDEHGEFINQYIESESAQELFNTKYLYNKKIDNSTKQVLGDFTKNASEYYVLLENITKTNVDINSGMNLTLFNKITKFKLNESYLKVTLRPYQTFGAKFALLQKNVIIGDEMGLGKTIQAIALLAHLKAQDKNRFLVVCPASVLINWYYEVQNHSTLDAIVLHGSNFSKSVSQWKNKDGVGITTFQTLSSYRDELKIDLNAIIVDEAHFVKNPKAKRTLAIDELSYDSEYILMLSGTPLENKVNEFTQLIKLLNPGLARQISKKMFMEDPSIYRERISTIYLRRKRLDVLKELPEIVQTEQWVAQDESQLSDYANAIRAKNFMLLRRISWIAGDTLNSPKMLRLVEIHAEAMMNGRKIIVFSFFREENKKSLSIFSLITLPSCFLSKKTYLLFSYQSFLSYLLDLTKLPKKNY